MSEIIWITKAGKITQVAEEEYFEFQLDAYDDSGSALSYKVISGTLSNGLQLTHTGVIQGITVINNLLDPKSFTQSFTVRVRNVNGRISDRTFSIGITPKALPQLLPKNSSLGTVDDGSHWIHQLEVIDPSPNAKITWRLVNGELPPGVTMDANGLLTGYIMPYTTLASQAQLNWSMTGWDTISWDMLTATAQSRTYKFMVQVFDGIRYDQTTYTLAVLAKAIFTVDSTQVNISNTNITVDQDNKHIPYIVTAPSALVEQRQGATLAFKFDGFDFDGDILHYLLIRQVQVFFDQGNATSSTTGWVLGPNDLPTPPVTTVGFDMSGLSQEAQVLPPGLTLDINTGWLTGVIGPQAEVKKVYKFQIYCYKASYPLYLSEPVNYTLTVLGDLNNVIDWQTPENLGSIVNGEISELAIVASARLPNISLITISSSLTISLSTKKSLRFAITPGIPDLPGVDPRVALVRYSPAAYSRLPQGLKLLDNGLIIGRPTFEYFSLDNKTTTFDKVTTAFDNKYTFSVTASDSTVFELDANRTTIDSKFGLTQTLFDVAYQGQYYQAATVSDTRTFTIRVDQVNKEPYENLFLRALPSIEKRKDFSTAIANQDIFTNELIYRINDPYYGKAKDIGFMFAAGLKPSTALNYFNTMQNNHYTKRIELGDVKTAVAVDENFKIKYEVVYAEVVDPSLNNGKSTPNSISTLGTVIHPNSLSDMLTEVSQVTYNNRGALPDWMTSPQADGRVLGFTPAVILAYTVPGASKLIAYRLKQENVNFGNLDFVVDRYQLDDQLITNYDITTTAFNRSEETTFDMLPPIGGLHPYTGSVDFAITIPFDEINGRTVEYINSAGGISGFTTIKSGQTLIFAIQENYTANNPNPIYIDVFDANNYAALGYDPSTTPRIYTSANDGWNDNSIGLYGSSGFSSTSYTESTVIPGYLSLGVNQRGGIWTISIDANLVVTLVFTKEVAVNEYVQILHSSNYNNTKLYYDPILLPGQTVPAYSVLTSKNYDIFESTIFDGYGTRFYSNRDSYIAPRTNDQFLKFPKYSMNDG